MIFIKKNNQLYRTDGDSDKQILVIVSSSGQSGIITGKNVPVLTAEQMTEIYNAVVDGKAVVIASANSEYFVVKQVNSDNDNVYVYFDFEETNILKYTLDENEDVTITTKEIGSGTGAVESVNGKVGVVVLNAGDILATNQQTIQANLERIDLEINRVEGKFDNETEDLQDQIDNLKSRGRYLSNWNALTGLPETEPSTELPYEYRQGDYFIVGTVEYNQYTVDRTYNTGDKVKYNGLYYECLEDGVSGIFDDTKWQEIQLVLYKPSGTEYDGTPSTTEETQVIAIGDEYIYDGTTWVFQKNAPIDLTNYPKLDEENTFTGTNTFNKPIKFGANGEIDSPVSNRTVIKGNITSNADNSRALGLNDYKWANVYTYKLTGATQNASTDDIINGLLGMDAPTSTTLTDEQIAKIVKSGVVINGSFSGFESLTLVKPQDTGTGYYTGIFILNNAIGEYHINKTTKAIYFYNEASESGIRLRSISHINGKAIPEYTAGNFVYDGSALRYVNNSAVADTSSTTFSGGLTSQRTYTFTQPLTSLSIASLDIQTGDLAPFWSVRFKVGSGFAFSSTPTINWKDGTPNWTSLVGEEIEIVFEASLTSGTYNAWVI